MDPGAREQHIQSERAIMWLIAGLLTAEGLILLASLFWL